MKVLILDGYNLIYRARYSFLSKNRDKSDLEDRSIIYSFIRAVRAQINKHRPDQVYFVLEGRPTRRLDLSNEYKANRVYEKDSGFRLQRGIIIDLVREWPGMTVIRHPQHECDDVAGAIALKHAASGDSIVIVSSDSDFCQSISDEISVFNPITKKFVVSPVAPNSYVSWKALRGDASDNISGFRGIGDIRAKKLIHDPNSLEEFLSVGSNRKKFEHNLEMIAFEHVDLDSCETMTTLSNDETFYNFRARLHDFGFFSITSDKAWRKFLDPISNMRNENAKCE